MGDIYISLTSVNPDHVPSDDFITGALSYISNELNPDEIEVKRNASPQLIIGGEIYHIILCPHCEKNITDDFFGDILKKNTISNGYTLAFTTPCCSSKMNLNDLTFTFDADDGQEIYHTIGFARYSIRCLYPNRNIRQLDLDELSKYFGTPVRAIIQYF